MNRLEELYFEFLLKKQMEEELALWENRLITYTVDDWALVDEDGEELKRLMKLDQLKPEVKI